jgi:hypothetical protein
MSRRAPTCAIGDIEFEGVVMEKGGGVRSGLVSEVR